MLLRKIFRRLFMAIQEKQPQKKTKTTLYMSDSDEQLLDEIFIKRLRDRRKTDRSALVCEGIRLLYEKEMDKKNS
jgi:hypothetical protein